MVECTNCLGTGRSNRGLSPYLDCADCGAAKERAELEAEFFFLGQYYSDSIWSIYQLGRKREREGK